MLTAPAARPTILVVDDVPQNLTVIVEVLKKRYRVKAARSGRRALELVAAQPPDLILLDVVMPEMDGYAVCRRLKADPTTRDIPVIFLTALREAANEAHGLSLGAADFITKPFNPAIVKARVSTQLDLVEARRQSERLLANTLPRRIIDDLKAYGHAPPRAHRDVSLLFSDMVGFTRIAARLDPEALMDELSDIFGAFDELVERWGGQRIKTIGDAYFCVCGMPEPRADHARRVVEIGLAFIEHLEARNRAAEPTWRIRIGAHSGDVVAGVVGRGRYQYDVFGDAVNVAARVERSSAPMRMSVSASTRAALGDDPRFRFVSRGAVALKGKGEMPLYFVERAA